MSEFSYDTHEVTTKAALYSTDGSTVLAMRYLRNPNFEYGLPGGHVDQDERPDQAMARELQEELNLAGITLERKDFFAHATGKIVLAYTGLIPKDTLIVPSEPEKEIGMWLTSKELQSADIDPGYKAFALRFWPQE